MSSGAVLWFVAGLMLGLGAGWFVLARRSAAQNLSHQQQIDALRQELADSLAAQADRDARIATLEAELELAPPRQASGAR